jgi:hypothetical protein
MVDKTENILVEFDYNNITIIDPNKVVDDNNNVSERYVSQENLVMYANLECTVLPRTKLAVGVSNDSAINTISIAKINFLKPGDKQYLDNSYTDDITGKNSIKSEIVNLPNQSSPSKPNVSDNFYIKHSPNSGNQTGTVDTGLLGITSIQIRQGLDFMPTVDVKLTDVKGRALFEGGNNSPYAAFFNLPYPLFYLTIKGYYGKAVRLALMLQNFTTTYNAETGNFVVDLKFYTYKYTVLSEITMAALMATPHMYQSRFTISATNGGPSKTTKTNDIVVERGYQKIVEVYSAYKSKGLISDDFPEITIMQMKDRIENFITNVLESFTKQNLDPLTDLDTYNNNLKDYQKDVFYTLQTSWFNKYMDVVNYYILNTGQKVYTFKKGTSLEVKSNAISDLKGILDKYNALLNGNKTCGENGSYEINGKKTECKIPNPVKYEIFPINVNYDSLNLEETYKAQRNNSQPTPEDLTKFRAELTKDNILNNITITLKGGGKQITSQYFVFEGKGSFIDLTDKMGKDLEQKRETIQEELTKALADLLESKDNGIGFIPNIRNVLAVIFANGEAFLRLMDDVHTKAWEQRDNKIRKSAIFDSTVSNANPDNQTSGANSTQPIYPWPQVIKATTGEQGQEKYEVRYPGDNDIISQTKGYLYDVWPEIEFVEEFLRGMTQKTPPQKPATDNTNSVTEPNRVSLGAIEFPVSNDVFKNKVEVNYIYEIYERILLTSHYSKLDRSENNTTDLDKVSNVIADGESINIKNSLSNSDVSLIKIIKDYNLTADNFESVLKHISNEGVGQSWQNFIRGVFNTAYINNYVNNAEFEWITQSKIDSSSSQPLVSLNKEEDISTYVSTSTSSNKYDFSDTYPFTDKKWVQGNLSNGVSTDEKLAFNTTKTLVYNSNKKVISNFTDSQSQDVKRPITNFVYKNIKTPVVINNDFRNFYATRTYENQLPTEGDVKYLNYTGLVSNYQTTSILNTPYFINAIQEGVERMINKEQYPFVSSAYLFLNSLPLSTLRDKFKTYTGSDAQYSDESLDYIFASLNKFGALHKMPYAWVLKIGSIWSRYKTYIETGNDFLTNCWKDFDYVTNFDPITNDKTRTYNIILPGQTGTTSIVLEQFTTASTTNGVSSVTTINTGFYPKLINDFNIFYQGFTVFTGYTNSDIQNGFNEGLVLNYVPEAVINNVEGISTAFNITNKVIPWSVSVTADYGQYQFIIPSNGSLVNQTKAECIGLLGNVFYELSGNTSMYNGSVRLFWTAPNYGYFDNSKVLKPLPTKYLREVWSGQSNQENFSINGENSQYTDISEIFSVFGKDTLDKFETEFLNFSKSTYEYVDNEVDETNTKKTFKNFQELMRSLMKITNSSLTNTLSVEEMQSKQLTNMSNIISQFLNYDIFFKIGNPSNFDRKLFNSFSTNRTALRPEPVVSPYTWDYYNYVTPNSLPSSDPNSPSLITSIILKPNEWKALETYVGFSNIPELVYKDDGSYITDFFIDCNVAFDVENIKNLHPIIRIYATQKLKDNTLNYDKFVNLMNEYLNTLDDFNDKIVNSTMLKIRKLLPNVNETPKPPKESVLESTQTKLELYDSFKATNDKWIAGNDFKNKTLFEDVLLLDRASRNIGEKVLIDIIKLKNTLTNIEPKASMLTYVNDILVTNNFVVMPLASYVNFYNVQDAVKNPKPKPDGTLEFANTMFGTFMNVDYRNSSAKLVCFYAGKPSQYVAVNNVDYRFKDDAFDLRRASDNPLNENQIGKNDWDKSNKVVGFNVEFGTQNQSIFKGFNVSQNPGLPTAESLEVINQMANQSGNRGGTTQNMSLYNLYKNRSYACQVSMMGNAMIQPTMYFNLRHVPMFSGPYMIQKVNHVITPGNFETTFEGIRQPTASLPLVENYIQSLKTSLLQSIIDKNNQKKVENNTNSTTASTSNVIGQSGQKYDENTKQNGTKPQNTQECPPVKTTDDKYGKFTPENPSGTTATYNEVIGLISSKTKGSPLSLAYSIFAKMYLNSSDSNSLNTIWNNYSGTKLTSDWGEAAKVFFTKKQYYCAGVGNTEPYVIFENLTQNIDFLISRFSGRVSEIKELTPSEITKFIILYGDAAIASSNVYTSMNPTNLTNMESKVDMAIKLYNSTTGNFTQTQQSATAPSPDPFDFVVEEVGGSFNKLTVTIKPNVGVWEMFSAKYHYYKVTSECGNSEGSGRRLDEYISTNKQTFTITRQNILDEEGCGPITPQQDLVGKYTYQIWIYANLDLPVTNVGERSREQAIWNDYVISFEIK